jgi:Chaperone of endosialidase
MTIYRGPGGTGEARTDSDVTEVRIIADEAEGYKDQAATSASAAASSASAAATAETNAETAEANAETAEANAEAAQAAAEDAQAAAEAAQAAAEAVYDDFDDRYLGAKSSNPSVDNDGDALATGALYFNTTDSDMRVYTGSAWEGLSASAGVTSFNTRTGAVTLTDTDVNTALGYTAANSSLVALKANNLSDLASASTARTNLGLGTAATTASTAYATAAQGTNADTAYGWGNHASAGYAADSAVVKLTGDQTVGGTKTFSSTITGSITGNAGTVTNGVYISGSYADPSWITSLAGSKVSGNISGNAATATTATNVSGGTASVTTLSVTGVTTVQAGTSSAPAITTSGDTNTGIFFPAADTIAFTEGGTEAMRIDSSGNVGIGTSSPSGRLNIAATAATSTTGVNLTGSTTGYHRVLFSNTTGGGQIGVEGSSGGTIATGTTAYATVVGDYANQPLQFIQNNSVRATINTSGQWLFNCTGQTVDAPNTAGGRINETNGNEKVRVSADSQVAFQFYSPTGGTGGPVGTITVNAASVSYNTSSDYRLKHDIQPMAGALAKVAALKPVTYKWNIDNSESQGFIAHELQEVAPECVSGEKDAVDAEGNPKYQGIDTSFLVATLAAALQEAHGLIKDQATAITALTARVEALENSTSLPLNTTN